MLAFEAELAVDRVDARGVVLRPRALLPVIVVTQAVLFGVPAAAAALTPPAPPPAPVPTMDLPKASDLLAQQLVVIVELHANGDVDVDREKIPTDDALRARVHRAVEASGPELRAVIRADRTVTYDRLIHVLGGRPQSAERAEPERRTQLRPR